jgi:hypothetical protein
MSNEEEYDEIIIMKDPPYTIMNKAEIAAKYPGYKPEGLNPDWEAAMIKDTPMWKHKETGETLPLIKTEKEEAKMEKALILYKKEKKTAGLAARLGSATFEDTGWRRMKVQRGSVAHTAWVKGKKMHTDKPDEVADLLERGNTAAVPFSITTPPAPVDKD